MHELLGVTSGRVSLAHVSGVADDLKEVVMSPAQDEFYAQVRLCYKDSLCQTDVYNLLKIKLWGLAVNGCCVFRWICITPTTSTTVLLFLLQLLPL